VEGEDVDDDRREQEQRERNEATGEQQDAGDDLGALDQGEHVAGGRERAHEGGRALAEGGHRQEVKEAVEAEHEKDEAEEDAGDRGDASHARDRVTLCHREQGC
jgi:hypothetical protein